MGHTTHKWSFHISASTTWLFLLGKSAPNINKFKNLLGRDPDLLVNEFDCDSYFFKENCSMLAQTLSNSVIRWGVKRLQKPILVPILCIL